MVVAWLVKEPKALRARTLLFGHGCVGNGTQLGPYGLGMDALATVCRLAAQSFF